MSGRRAAPSPPLKAPRRATRPRLARGVAAHTFFLTLCCFAVILPAAGAPRPRQSAPTPLQREIEIQRARLSSPNQEERRDAVTRLGAMARPEGSRAAAAALGDASAVVRATAARAVLSLGPGEAAALLLPLLRDRDEFVRREAAHALGMTRSTLAVSALAAALETDREASVRGAAAVALGRIGDASAAPALIGAISRRLQAPGFFNRLRRRRIEEDEFVRRSSAAALGLLRSREGVPVLIAALSDERTPDDVRREAAQALGLIGDPAAVPALRAALAARDPYLSRIAFEALRKLDPANSTRPT